MARFDPALAGLAIVGGAQQWRRWLPALAISLVLHAGILAMQIGGKPPAAAPPPLRVRLPPTTGEEPAVPAGEVAAPRAIALPRAAGVRRERGGGRVVQAPAGEVPGSQQEGPGIDLAAARALARGIARTPDGGRSSAGEAAPALADRPALPALAQRMGPPAAVVSEKMVGGSRLIRFRDGRCLLIPVDVPAWRESRVVPTEWATTNCPQ